MPLTPEQLAELDADPDLPPDGGMPKTTAQAAAVMRRNRAIRASMPTGDADRSGGAFWTGIETDEDGNTRLTGGRMTAAETARMIQEVRDMPAVILGGTPEARDALVRKYGTKNKVFATDMPDAAKRINNGPPAV